MFDTVSKENVLQTRVMVFMHKNHKLHQGPVFIIFPEEQTGFLLIFFFFFLGSRHTFIYFFGGNWSQSKSTEWLLLQISYKNNKSKFFFGFFFYRCYLPPCLYVGNKEACKSLTVKIPPNSISSPNSTTCWNLHFVHSFIYFFN